ncbi:MAG: replication initiation factor domain-containing protein [Oscillospiraceae bacterium]|nr:replication initiation factor domain-containing protein [Oscillospiraceae bacterium]
MKQKTAEKSIIKSIQKDGLIEPENPVKKRKENIILYDWLTVTSQIDSPQTLIELFGLENLKFESGYGRYFYKQRLFCGKINVYFDGHDENMGVCLEMSGQGCREFETFGHGDWDKLFSIFFENDGEYNVARLDVALDDYQELLNIFKIADYTRQELYIAKAQSTKITYSKEGKGQSEAVSVTFGSRSSETLIRIYDKAKERGYEDDTHWVRCEMQLKGDHAKNFILVNKPVGEKFRGVLNNYLRFTVPDKNNSNECRWKTRAFWTKFLDTSEKISVYSSKDIVYNLSRLEYWLIRQQGNNLDVYIQCLGIEELLKVIESRDSFLKVKHKYIINEFNRERVDSCTITKSAEK